MTSVMLYPAFPHHLFINHLNVLDFLIFLWSNNWRNTEVGHMSDPSRLQHLSLCRNKAFIISLCIDVTWVFSLYGDWLVTQMSNKEVNKNIMLTIFLTLQASVNYTSSICFECLTSIELVLLYMYIYSIISKWFT